MSVVVNKLRDWLVPPELTVWRFAGRLLLIVVQVLLAYCFAGQSNPFFYQAF